eukprot:CAMPEP_0172913056 /NCGR_PEP_ID=MMETSP1075-20121228/189618_1 /TAXON_ID=2916 /ORGANISM="Ceratium fusus, Strain PA161109" /LENGTH=35 /DNA_ID= /DNA_START= /DNA_END= /DNA_ORIENTATION=
MAVVADGSSLGSSSGSDDISSGHCQDHRTHGTNKS